MLTGSFKQVYIKHQMCLMGEPPILPMPFKDLVPGDLVVHVGHGGGVKSGGITSSASLAQFDPAIEYTGKIELNGPNGQPAIFICFKIPDGGITGFKPGEEQDVYITWIVSDCGKELYNPYVNSAGPSIEIYQARFLKQCDAG